MAAARIQRAALALRVARHASPSACPNRAPRSRSFRHRLELGLARSVKQGADSMLGLGRRTDAGAGAIEVADAVVGTR
eukprot:1752834-Rhodomonas_salina.2